MPAAAESLGQRMPFVRRGLRLLPLALCLSLLAACGLSPDWGQSPPPKANPARAPLPTPTAFILSSEALYARDRRHHGATSVEFASLPAGAVLPPAPSGRSERGVSVLLDARAVVQGELYRSGQGSQPAILILGADVSSWSALPLKLSQAGFVVLALQIGSETPARLVDSMLQSLIAIPGVDAGRIGMVGEARSADLAMLGCAVNSLCDALALFSPTSRETLLNMLPSFGERALWLASSRGDSESHAAALTLSQALRGRAQFVEVERGRGAGLLHIEPGLADQVVAFFALHLNAA